MIMTRETDYAVRILRALSCGERMTVRQVCDLELVPVQFAYKILKMARFNPSALPIIPNLSLTFCISDLTIFILLYDKITIPEQTASNYGRKIKNKARI